MNSAKQVSPTTRTIHSANLHSGCHSAESCAGNLITWIGKARHSPAPRTPPACCDPKQHCQFIKPGRSESAWARSVASAPSPSVRAVALHHVALANRGANSCSHSPEPHDTLSHHGNECRIAESVDLQEIVEIHGGIDVDRCQRIAHNT